MCKNAFRLIIDTMRTSRHLPIALDLLFPAHIASLPHRQRLMHSLGREVEHRYPRYPSSLGLTTLVKQSPISKNGAGQIGQAGNEGQSIWAKITKNLRWRVDERRCLRQLETVAIVV
jgi:hypothetical protein